MLPDLSGHLWSEARAILRGHRFEGEQVQVLDVTPAGEAESRLRRSSQTAFVWGETRVVRLQVLEGAGEVMQVTIAREMVRARSEPDASAST